MAEPVKPLMIAHAGGGYQGMNYTNSIQALEHNYQAGFKYFEIDFSWTSDDELVCLHDWQKTFKKLFRMKTKQPLSLAEFNRINLKQSAFTVCNAATLAQWAANKSDVRIITDIKHNNLAGIEKLIKDYPALKSQIIPQFYQPEEYPVLKNWGFDDLIWILYQYKGNKNSVVELSQTMDLTAVSMRARQAKNKTLQKLLLNHDIFVYTVNKSTKKNKLTDHYGVTGIYTDFLEN